MIDLGEWVRTHRIQAELTQETLARRIGTSVGSITRWERSVTLPRLGEFVSLCIEFRASADEALGLLPHLKPSPRPPRRVTRVRSSSNGARTVA